MTVTAISFLFRTGSEQGKEGQREVKTTEYRKRAGLGFVEAHSVAEIQYDYEIVIDEDRFLDNPNVWLPPENLPRKYKAFYEFCIANEWIAGIAKTSEAWEFPILGKLPPYYEYTLLIKDIAFDEAKRQVNELFDGLKALPA